MNPFSGEGGNSPSFNNHRTDLNKLGSRVKEEQWEEEGKQKTGVGRAQQETSGRL